MIEYKTGSSDPHDLYGQMAGQNNPGIGFKAQIAKFS
jgi:hypothetical protein